MKILILDVKFLDYWHVGSGRGEGKHLDAVVDKDAAGLPYVPGRMLKGLLRDACWRLETWKHPEFSTGFTESCFGEEASRHTTKPGCLYVGNASLPPDVSAWLAAPQQVAQKQAFYRPLHATAIDETRGCARKNSLRGIEVVVPLALAATLEIDCSEPDQIEKILRLALPLIRHVGAHRARGLGRVVLTLGGAA